MNTEDSISWEKYFIEIAKLTALRSSCIRKRVGCVIVNDRNIVSLGYNGTVTSTLTKPI